MELRQLKTFEAICRNLSFTKAAKELGYSQSAITIQIQQLEEEFHTRFFDRIGRNVTLTTEGQVFREKAQDILESVTKLETSLTQSPIVHAPLHVGTIDSLCDSYMLEHVKEYLSANPGHSVSITTGSPEQLIAMLNRNKLDMIYILDQAVDDILWEKPLVEEESIVFVTHHTSRLCKAMPRRLVDLVSERFLLTEKVDNYRRSLEQELARRGLAFRAVLEVPHTDMICQLVREGYGIAFLPEFVVHDDVERGELCILPMEDYALTMQRQLIHHKKKWITRDMEEFLDIVKRSARVTSETSTSLHSPDSLEEK